MTEGQILLVHDDRDIHSSLVLPHLDREPIIFDPAAIPDGFEISYLQNGTREVVYLNGHELPHVTSIWWRKMMDLTAERVPLEAIPHEEHEYACRSVRRHADALGSWFEDALWVSNPYTMSRASNKPWQLRIANEIGLAVPRTLQTSDPTRAQAFVEQERNRGGCIVKSLSNRFPVRPNGDELMFWSQQVPDGQSFEGIELAPSIFQQYIVGLNLRVTVVDTSVFTAKITSRHEMPPGVPDYRVIGQGIEGKLLIEPYILPPMIAAKCIALVKRLGLLSGSIDIVVDASGVFWFLENNTMGAWGFVEEATGQPIGRAVAHLLMRV